ncbi:MAG: Gfo/Idh/MocA family oxidoreductase [Chthoniobacteraceae bacterium]
MPNSQYEPQGPAKPVVKPGEFFFAASHFDHGHIYDQVRGLVAAGGVCKAIYEPREEKLSPLQELIAGGVRLVSRFEDLLEDPGLALITTAAIPDERCGLGLRVMDAGKDYFTDKAPFTTLEQLEWARQKVAATGRKYAVNYSERLCSEAAWQAGEILRRGALGKVLQVLNLAPHNLAPQHRPGWFFTKARYGGILTDIGSHQFEQFLHYAGATDGTVNFARVENFATPDYPELEDFGEASLTLDTGASGYCRIDWLNPKGSKTWGDGRTFALGTNGYLEIRKTINLGTGEDGEKIYVVDEAGTQVVDCKGRVGWPFFGQLILDVLERTEKAMPQAHAFKAAELSLQAQAMADLLRKAAAIS